MNVIMSPAISSSEYDRNNINGTSWSSSSRIDKTSFEVTTTSTDIDEGYNHHISNDSNSATDHGDPLNDLKNHLIVAFVVVSLLMLCYLLLCINSFLYEMTCCPSKKSKQLKHYKGKLMYPLPWDATAAMPNKEYSCSDLKATFTAVGGGGTDNDRNDDGGGLTSADFKSCDCQLLYVDEELINDSVSTTSGDYSHSCSHRLEFNASGGNIAEIHLKNGKT